MAATWRTMRALKIHGKLHELLLLRCHNSFSRSLRSNAFIVRNVTCLAPVYISQRTHKLAGNVRPVKLACVSPLLSPTLLYSTKSTDTGSVTENILKAKLAEATQSERTETGDDSRKTDTDNTTSDSKEKEKGKSSDSDSWFSAKHGWKLGLLGLTLTGMLLSAEAVYFWGMPERDEEGHEIPDEFTYLPSHTAYPKRAWKMFKIFKTTIQEPSSKKLLPDPLKEPYYQPPYTLVLEVTGVLVHPDWTLSTGWRFKKRPAVDYFLQQVGPPLFEVVVYTHEQGFTAFPIIDGLDPNGFISYRLFRDATRYQDGQHMKDLNCLNRDLSKVIIIDCDPAAFAMHPRNAIPLPKWTGNDNDKTLVDLASFLRTIAASNVEDVRTVLDHYNQFDDPLQAFKENQRRLQEEQEKRATGSEKQESTSLVGGWARGLTGRRRT